MKQSAHAYSNNSTFNQSPFFASESTTDAYNISPVRIPEPKIKFIEPMHRMTNTYQYHPSFHPYFNRSYTGYPYNYYPVYQPPPVNPMMMQRAANPPCLCCNAYPMAPQRAYRPKYVPAAKPEMYHDNDTSLIACLKMKTVPKQRHIKMNKKKSIREKL